MYLTEDELKRTLAGLYTKGARLAEDYFEGGNPFKLTEKQFVEYYLRIKDDIARIVALNDKGSVSGTACIYASELVGKELDLKLNKHFGTIAGIIRKMDMEKAAHTKVPNTLEPVEKFEVRGDIMITDPCYMDKYIRPLHSRSTIYGDWTCDTREIESKDDLLTYDSFYKGGSQKQLGSFCADSGQVSVTNIKRSPYREELLRLEKKGIATVIRGFKGTVQYFVLRECEFSWSSKRFYTDDSLVLYGEGTKDGKPFKFGTRQSGF